jgi:UDP-2,3-diacylglucosamine hydrolase
VGINNENTNGVTGLCLEVHDLAISKYVAGRPKDLEFTGELARHNMIEHKTLLERLGKTDLSSTERSRIKSRIDSNFRAGGRAYGSVVLNAFFVSDLHIGSPTDSRATLFLEFLKNLSGKENASHLFLMGDIFDLWIAAHRYFIDKFRPIIDEIVRLRDEGVEIHYFEGNHDLYLRHYWSDEMGFTVHEGPAYFELGHQTVRIEHGDQMDPDDRGYQFLRWFLRTPPLKFLMPRLPSRLVVMIGKKSTETSRVYTSETKTMMREETIRKIRTHAETVHAQMPFNLIISGHVQVRDQYLVNDGQIAFKSVNLGTWLDAPCYYQIDETGGRLVDLTDTP